MRVPGREAVQQEEFQGSTVQAANQQVNHAKHRNIDMYRLDLKLKQPFYRKVAPPRALATPEIGHRNGGRQCPQGKIRRIFFGAT